MGAALGRLRSWAASPEVRSTLLAGLVAFGIYEVARNRTHQVQNTYVWLGDAFLHLRLHLDRAAPDWLDWVWFRGRKYSHQGPLPGVLIMPFVAAFGLDFNETHFGAVLGGLISAAAWSVAGRLSLRGWRRVAAWAFPVLGTSVWYEAKEGSTWGVAALGSVLFLLLALREYFGPRRPHLVGLLVGLASLCRPPAILALGGFALGLRHYRKVVALGLGALGPVLAMVGYNWARFGTLTDKSLEIHYLRDSYRFQVPPGIFSLAHVPFNTYTWFFGVPAFSRQWPFLRPTIMGTAITITSPAFLAALGARRHRWLWACCIVVIPAALLYGNGFAQFGMRYLLDAVPFLFALVGVALADGRAPGYLPLLAWSVAFNAYGVAYTNVYGLQP